MRYGRFLQIGGVLLTHGLDDLVPKRFRPWYFKIARKGLFWWPNRHKGESQGKRLRLALQELGPVFVKFGQMLSTRRDLLPDEMVTELTRLQDKVPPFDSNEAKEIIRKALDLKDLNELFSEFEHVPLASASVAQVHSAKLKGDNKDVVVKVLRPNIKQTIEADVDLLISIAQLVQDWLPNGKRLRPVEVVKEYKRTILDELDLLREAANAIQVRRSFKNSDSLYVPYVYSEHCRINVIVMERIYGIPVSEIDTLRAQNTNLKVLAERGVEVFFTQVFRDSFFHADMHPGNIFVSFEHPENPKYIGIDYGIVGTLNKQDKRYLAENFIAFFNRNYRKVAELHIDSGWVPADTDIDDFEMAIRTVCEPIFQKPLAEISFGNVLLQLFTTAQRFNMTVQPQLVLLQKTLLYVEGLGRTLYPQLDLWKTAKPFLEKWMKDQIGPQALYNQLKENLPFWSEKLPEMPDLLYDTLRQIKQMPIQAEKQHLASLALHVNIQKARMLGKVAVTFSIAAAVLYVFEQHWLLSCGSALVALFAWYFSFKRLE
ncbi:probable ubiquinone biosynthesis protein ubiB [Glaciecola punicea ACAM 611]|jgi:ubiquinone biosynthesis protein|uniref:Probable protein kinase UbiB n=1 Tax=Glaciecola punicea ACAM 611 TaxID=1121923 RepID=H5TFF2_9ALTE|nr:ubiquinone biosynthesis regulatory protein kinase UbiB [Glaciecola punicea]OFA32642.1 ubiquinone biosynthesis regulatory protein kinase UbiB [Glaciecola punicea]GAB56832.1 probable ubiquinone biosynthesis protein ubiB [Glaciecola punicea ACAM 611]